MAMEESRVLVWHRDKLKLSIMSDGFLQAVFDHILGRDVVHKLMQVCKDFLAFRAKKCTMSILRFCLCVKAGGNNVKQLKTA